MKTLQLFVLVGITVLVIAACGGGQAPSTPVSWYALKVDAGPSYSGGGVSQEPEANAQGQYAAGTVVTLTAGPSGRKDCHYSPYWSFVGWSGDLYGSKPTAEITMDSDKSVAAGFKEFFPPGCRDDPTKVSVVAQDLGGSGAYAFDPDDLTFTVGETWEFSITSETEFHTFTVGDLGIDVDVDGGTTETFTFTFDKPGTFKLVCIPHEGLGMTGTITVKPTSQ